VFPIFACASPLTPRATYDYLLGRVRDASVFFTSRVGPVGTNVFSKSWDVLVILDACRVDALRSVAEEYSFLGAADSSTLRSVGSSSPQWIANTFTDARRDVISDTAYISANPYAKYVLENGLRTDDIERNHTTVNRLKTYGSDWEFVDADALGRIEHLWRVREEPGYLSKPNGYTPPTAVTDETIRAGRHGNFDRIIAHYNQPHRPYLANAIAEQRDLHDYELDTWEYLKNGGDRERALAAYRDELRWVLDEVAVLLENLDADAVAISADHGEAFGKYGVYGHPTGSVHPRVRTVPWMTMSSTDHRTRIPDV